MLGFNTNRGSTSMRIVPLIAVIAAGTSFLQPSAAHAAEDSTEFWVELGASGEIAPGAELKLEVEERRREGPNEYIVGAVVDFEVSDRLELGGGMEIHDEDGFTEIRPYQQLTYSTGRLSFRTRLEERFYDNADRMALRLRQRAQYTHPLAERTKAKLSAELLYQLRDRNEGGPERIDQWRFNAGVQHRLLPRLDVTGGYLFQIRPRPDGQTRHTHVPQLTLTYKW